MSRYLALDGKGSCELAKREKCEPVTTAQHSPALPQPRAATNSLNSHFASSQSPPHARVLAALEARCPDHVPVERWQQAVEDGKHFLAKWGEQALALGWTADALFGLHKPPDNPQPRDRRLRRDAAQGRIWVLQAPAEVRLLATRA